MEGAADHILLLLACQPDEVDGIAGHTDRELRILVRMLHRVFERFFIDHVQIHVESALIEIHVDGLGRGRDEFLVGEMRLLRGDRHGVADAVLRIPVGQLRDREAGCEPSMAVAAVHRVRARCEGFPLAPAVGRVAGRLAVDHVRRDRQHALRMRCAAIGRVLAELLHEARHEVRRDAVHPVVVIPELRDRRLAFIHIVDGKAGLIADDADLSVFDRRKTIRRH